METDRLVRKAGKTFTTWRPWLSIKPSANLAGLLALPCRIAEFSFVPPHNEEGKTVDPDELSTTNTKLLINYFWQMVIYIYLSTLWLFNIAMENHHVNIGKPSISMGHLYHGKVFVITVGAPFCAIHNNAGEMSSWCGAPKIATVTCCIPSGELTVCYGKIHHF